MLEKLYIIKNKTGLHARPASIFVRKAGAFKCSVKLVKNNQVVDAKSIISLLTLGAANGDAVNVITEGEDEQTAMTELLCLLDSFDD